MQHSSAQSSPFNTPLKLIIIAPGFNALPRFCGTKKLYYPLEKASGDRLLSPCGPPLSGLAVRHSGARPATGRPSLLRSTPRCLRATPGPRRVLKPKEPATGLELSRGRPTSRWHAAPLGGRGSRGGWERSPLSPLSIRRMRPGPRPSRCLLNKGLCVVESSTPRLARSSVEPSLKGAGMHHAPAVHRRSPHEASRKDCVRGRRRPERLRQDHGRASCMPLRQSGRRAARQDDQCRSNKDDACAVRRYREARRSVCPTRSPQI